MQAIRVLLIEDCLELGDLLQEVLQAECESVSWFVRARTTTEGVLLMNAEGKEILLDCSRYDLALVDGRLKGSSMDGWDLIPYLVAGKLPAIAMSGDPWFNKRMVELGAAKSLDKFDIMKLARKGVLLP
jgi:DNA-binding response OmpR family regulator